MTFNYFPKLPSGAGSLPLPARRHPGLGGGAEPFGSDPAPASAGYLKIQLAASITMTPPSSVR